MKSVSLISSVYSQMYSISGKCFWGLCARTDNLYFDRGQACFIEIRTIAQSMPFVILLKSKGPKIAHRSCYGQPFLGRPCLPIPTSNFFVRTRINEMQLLCKQIESIIRTLLNFTINPCNNSTTPLHTELLSLSKIPVRFNHKIKEGWLIIWHIHVNFGVGHPEKQKVRTISLFEYW